VLRGGRGSESKKYYIFGGGVVLVAWAWSIAIYDQILSTQSKVQRFSQKNNRVLKKCQEVASLEHDHD